jgi:hypothetical protein
MSTRTSDTWAGFQGRKFRHVPAGAVPYAGSMSGPIRRLAMRLPVQPRDFLRNVAYLLRSDASQFGEQAMLAAHLPPLGTYLELGAYQPVVLSNTWSLSRRGWRGWSVDANDTYRTQWRIFRPRNTFIHAAVLPDDDHGAVTLYHDRSGVGNTSSLLRDHLARHVTDLDAGLVQEAVPAIGIGRLLQGFIAKYGARPDLLHVDCEGLDVRLVEGLLAHVAPQDWPDFLLIEVFEPQWSVPEGWPYREIARVGLSVLMRRSDDPLA